MFILEQFSKQSEELPDMRDNFKKYYNVDINDLSQNHREILANFFSKGASYAVMNLLSRYIQIEKTETIE